MNLISTIRTRINGRVLPLINMPKPFSFVGAGSSLSLCREIKGTGVKRVLLITDGPLFKMGLVDPIVANLKDSGITVEVYSDVVPDPGFDIVMAGVEKLKAFKADAVLAVGGGSSIDCAKAILMCHANNAHPSTLTGIWLYAKPRKKILPFFAVPTTAGTGSEVTIAAVVSDKVAQIKYAMVDPKMVPSMIALDPSLMTGLPPFITAPTGMDALTHAVEAYISTMATAETDELARMATASIIQNLPQAYSNGSDIGVREAMAVASSMAGLAFTRAGVGYVHAFAHQMGGLYHVPHGLANAIILPLVLEFSKVKCAHRLAELARVSGIGQANASDDQLAEAFITHIRQMNADMAIPTTFKDLKREDFDKIIDRALSEAHGTYGVPRYMSREDSTEMLNKLMA
ncbi:MAG TPA: iron-containing alcohol dehydrogenase [Pseudomonas sp.]|nr:iron-containing alcohol dehydrogenase [Pseudomonas sp.]